MYTHIFSHVSTHKAAHYYYYRRYRTSRYASCVGKMNYIPVIRVNGENPDSVMKAAMVALSYRNMWQKDVIVDMLCYRR